MARKKKAVTKKAIAKRGPGRPRKAAASDFNFPKAAKAMAVKPKTGRPAKKQVSDLEFALLRGAINVHDKIIEDLRVRLNDVLYRVERLENCIKQGPGLMPVLVTPDSDINKLSPRTLAQVLLSRLVESNAAEVA